MMNIFFAAICVYLAYSAVDMSFELVKHDFEIKTPKIESEINVEDVLDTAVKFAELTKLEPVVKKSVERVSIASNVSYRSLDFTPKKTVLKKTEKRVKNKISFIQMKKKLPSIVSVTDSKLNFIKKDSSKRSIKKVELELSYTEIPEQGKFKINKIKQIAWSDKKIDFSKYEISKKTLIAANEIKKEVNDDRISTAASAPERSASKNNSNNFTNSDSMNFQAKSTKVEFQEKATEVATLSKKTNDDELEFFDYDNPESTEKVMEKEVPQIVDNEIKEVTSLKPNAFDPLSIQSQIVTTLNQKPTISAKNTDADLAAVVASIKRKSVNPVAPKVTQVEPPVVNPDKINNNENKTDEEQNGFVSNKNYACLDPKDLVNDDTFKTKYKLSLTSVDYSKKNFQMVRNFEVRFHDDINESKKDFGEGVIGLEFKMNTQMAVRRGTFYSRGYYPTTVDLVFEPGSLKADIPAFTVQSFNKVIEDQGLKGLGAHLLVELDDITEDVELDKDTKYEGKFYLNKSLKIVSRSAYDYQYILFVGAEVGNTVIKFRNNKDQLITKLIHLSGDEIYYEPNFYAEVDKDYFAVYEERLLSKCKSILNVDSKKIEAWSFDGMFTKESLNKVKVSNMIYPLGTRKYYEFKHLNESIFVGRWSEENVIVPSEEYISHVISKFDLDQSDSKCVIQLNISKPISEIAFNGQSGNDNMNMQINILDKDGQFYDSFSEQSERAFLMGEEKGVISIKIDYKDGSRQYLQSYCSDATYIVEQL